MVPTVAPLETEMTGVFFSVLPFPVDLMVTLVVDPPTRDTLAVGTFLAGFGVGFLVASRSRRADRMSLTSLATCGRSYASA